MPTLGYWITGHMLTEYETACTTVCPHLHTQPVLWHALVLREVGIAWVDTPFLCLSHQQKAQAAMVAAAAQAAQ